MCDYSKRRKLGKNTINLIVQYDGEEAPAKHALQAEDYSTSPDSDDYCWCFLKVVPSASGA